MTMILTISDGSTTCNLIWHSSGNRRYILARDTWAPAVAPRRRGMLWACGPYDEVSEEIVVHVVGETPAEALANLAALGRLMDQAERWWRTNEPASAVTIQYMPEGGSGVLQSAILGRDPGDETSGINLPVTFNSDLSAYMIANLRLRFRRRGWWVGADSTPATSSSAAAPAIHSVTFADNQLVSSPAKVTIGGLSNLSAAFSGFLAVTDSASDMALIEAESLGFPANSWNSVADANARGGNVLRWSRNTTTFTASASTGGTTVAARAYAVYATVRNNSATMNFLLRIAYKISIHTRYTPPVVVLAGATSPQAILLGVVTLGDYTPVTNHSFTIEAAQTESGAGHTIDIDTLLVINLDDEMSRIVAVPNFALSTGNVSLIVDDRILTSPNASAGDMGQVPPYYTPYQGDVFFCSKGTSMAACLFATQGANWLVKNTTPATVQTNLTAVRHNAAVVPS